MSGDTAISWTATHHPDGRVTPGKVWNPVVGCTKVSSGCKFCYAAELHDLRHQCHTRGQLQGVPQYAHPFSVVQLLPSRLAEPLRWGKPRRIFVNSMADLYHEQVPQAYLDQVFAVMMMAHWRRGHTFQILTKRPERMRAYLRGPDTRARVALAAAGIPGHLLGAGERLRLSGDLQPALTSWAERIAAEPGPLTSAGIWLGTSVEDQRVAETRIPALLDTPAAVRFLSCEPLLGPVTLWPWIAPGPEQAEHNLARYGAGRPLHWVIAGGESGLRARPMQPEWARTLRDECRDAGVPFFFKQWGTHNERGERAPRGRGWKEALLDGEAHLAFPGHG